MLEFFSQPSRPLFFLRTVVPTFVVALLINAAAGGLLVWAARGADDRALERQLNLVGVVVSQLRSRISHDQESVTVWDDAVDAVRSADSGEWIDVNLGSWMSSYFGHDGAYVLDASNRPIYAYADGARRAPDAYEVVAAQAVPLIEELRGRLRAGDTEGVSDQILTIGASDLSVVAGHPAIVSVKPIVSDSGEIEQVPGDEYLHVAVRYLDGSFVDELEGEYLLEQLRFSWTGDGAEAGGIARLAANDGDTVGYFTWSPFRPGAAVLAYAGPAMLALCVIGLVALAIFIAALRRGTLKLSLSEATVRHLANHDLLTGLPNRAQFLSRVDDALAKAGREECLALLYLDLDHFKEVNDTLGHPCGDELLREFADRLRRLTREGDTVARVGGDEFLVLLRKVTSREEVEGYCRAIVENARRPFTLEGNQVFVGVSVGVAISPKDGRERVELARRADVALYHAKRTGRSNYAIYREEFDSAVRARRAMEHDLRQALEEPDQLQVFYQPLLSTSKDRVTGVEALLRWKHPTQGWILPETIIPLAEETGLIERLGEWVLREACNQASSWPIETMAVNVSIVELQNPGYAVRVANVLMATGMNPRRLELEVTESAFSDTTGECERNIAALREMGVRFALDDFGTGFSSLGRLHQLAVDRLKIDRSFVDGFGKQSGDEAIVQAIVDLARAVGLKTTAEGVETQQQQSLLRNLGCDDLQGFLISRPLPAAEMGRFWSGGGAAGHDEPRRGASSTAAGS